jgi:hypothetical protein
VFTEVGQKALLDTFNEVRRTIAFGEEEGQPPAANMKKMVIILLTMHNVNDTW